MTEVTKQGQAGSRVQMGLLDPHKPTTAWVRVHEATFKREALVNLPAEEFLAGVAEAFDVIITERKDLPEAEAGSDGRLRIQGSATPWKADDAETHWRIARRHIALAEYVEANPPVDQEALDALTQAVGKINGFDKNSTIARALYDQGVRVVSE